MSEDIAIRSLKIFTRFAPHSVRKTIILTGGEPTLNLRVISTLFENTPKLLDNYRFIIFTNGTKIDFKMANMFKENKALVLLSIDGDMEQHNIMRRDFKNIGSFNATMEGYNVCKKCGCNVGISGVAGSHNIDTLDTETINFYLKINPISLGLNFPHYLLGQDNSNLITMEEYTDKIISVYKKARAEGLYLENICRIIEPFVKQSIRGKECAALGRGITVLPDGTVGPCKTLLVAGIVGKHISYIEDLDNLSDDDEFSTWSKRSTFNLEVCKDCIGVSLCGSGCAYDSYVLYKNIENIDPRACVFTKKLLSFLIEELFKIVKDRCNNNIIFPSVEDRAKILVNVELDNDKINRSAGHDVIENGIGASK